MTGLYVVFLFAIALVTLLLGAAVLLALIKLASQNGKGWGAWLRRLLCRFLFDCFDKKDGPEDHRPA